MNYSNFSLATAQDLVSDSNPFPVDFDIAWQWLDYSRKDNAKQALFAAGFVEGIDLLINQERRENISSSHFGGKQVTTVETILLTIDCLKMWAMMSGTQKGKEVRLYFLDCEKIAKAKAYTPPPPVAPIETKLMVTNELRLINESTLPASVKQLLIDSLVNEYLTDSPKLTASPERWVGIAQKAEELGFKTNASNRTKLGIYATKEAKRLARQTEERLCNGQMRSIWVYLDSPELESVVREYFAINYLRALD